MEEDSPSLFRLLPVNLDVGLTRDLTGTFDRVVVGLLVVVVVVVVDVVVLAVVGLLLLDRERTLSRLRFDVNLLRLDPNKLLLPVSSSSLFSLVVVVLGVVLVVVLGVVLVLLTVVVGGAV